jgi:hypothetical protein
MGFFKVIDKGAGPTRLFVGGVHGKEGRSTIKALSRIEDSDVKDGKLIIYNCDDSEYISTLDKRYYNSKVGREILSLIIFYQPEMYVEPHCYKVKSYKKLTEKNRKEKIGVPPLIELEKNVLIGSVSPFIRTTFFNKTNVCLTLEMPCKASSESLEVYLNILKIIAGSNKRSEIENKIMKIYPAQVETSKKYAIELFGDYPPF